MSKQVREEEFKYEKLARAMAGAFLATYGAVSMQVEGYNDFIKHQLPGIITGSNPIKVHSIPHHTLHMFWYENVTVQKPMVIENTDFARKLMPKEAHIRKLTYSFSVFVDIRHKFYCGDSQMYRLKEHRLFRNVLLIQIPCMTGTIACNTFGSSDEICDPGHFIINGHSKVIISHEELKCNYPYIFHAKYNNKSVLKCEIRSFHANKIRSTSTLNILMISPSNIEVQIPFISKPVPLFVVFRLLGLQTSREMMACIVGIDRDCSGDLMQLLHQIFDPEVNQEYAVKSRDDLLEWVGERGSPEKTTRKRIQSVTHILHSEFLPHCNRDSSDEANVKAKAFYIGFSVHRLLCVQLGETLVDDKDSYKNKRLCTAGPKVALLVRQLLRLHNKSLQSAVYKAVPSSPQVCLTDFLNPNKISSSLRYHFNTGNWSVDRSKPGAQTGVCQIWNDMNPVSALTHLRMVKTPILPESKRPEPRKLHNSHWGLRCAADTPEGRSAGLLSPLAFFARVRMGCPSRFMLEILHRDGDVQPLGDLLPGMAMVYVNNIVAGFTARPDYLVKKLRRYRQWFHIPVECSISFDHKLYTVVIDTDAKDLVRPLIRVSELDKLASLHAQFGNQPRVFWYQLLIEGVVEFVNKMEEEDLYVAVHWRDVDRVRHTHMEIHPVFTMYGISAMIIPFSNHNQSPRNIYQSSMCKQAVGSQPMDAASRFPTMSMSLMYPQKSLVQTWGEQLIGLEEQPMSQTCVVAFMCYGGNGQEDAIIVKREALQRGMFNIFKTQCYRDTETTHGVDTTRFRVDPDAVGRKDAIYDHVDKRDGIVNQGQSVAGKHVLVSKTIEYSQMTNKKEQKEAETSAPTNPLKKSKSRKKSKKDTDEKSKHATDYKFRRITRDKSMMTKTNEPAIVDRVILMTDPNGLRSTIVSTVSKREPEPGDKLSSRHGQKGIIGEVMRSEDMPFAIDGMIPDIIINPHAIPTRMTIGQLLETLLGKICAENGEIGDGTAFRGCSETDWKSHTTLEEMRKHLKGLGICSGVEKKRMRCGKTGELMKHPVFMGLAQYLRLKHCVQDKIHYRTLGSLQILLRQAMAGRKRNGGIKIGEMERDALIAHGISGTILERMVNASDKFETVVCTSCGNLAEHAAPKDAKTKDAMHHRPYCRGCDSHEHVKPITMTYVLKLIKQELAACHIDMKLEF